METAGEGEEAKFQTAREITQTWKLNLKVEGENQRQQEKCLPLFWVIEEEEKTIW